MTSDQNLRRQAETAQAAAEYSQATSSDTRTMGEINQAAKIIATTTMKVIYTASLKTRFLQTEKIKL